MIRIKSIAPFPDYECREFTDRWEFVAWLQRLEAYDKLHSDVKQALQTLVDELCRGPVEEEWEIRPPKPHEDADVIFIFSCCDMSTRIEFDNDGDCDFRVGVAKPNTVAEILNEHRVMFLR